MNAKPLKRLSACFLAALLCILILPVDALAKVNVNVYDGAIPIKQFKEEYTYGEKEDVQVSHFSLDMPEEYKKDRTLERVLIARPYEGGPTRTPIDYISLEYNDETIVLPPHEEIIYGSDYKITAKVHYTFADIKYNSRKTWEDIVGDKEVTTFNGLPAIDTWKGKEWDGSGMTGGGRVLHILLVDDTHLPGSLTLRIQLDFNQYTSSRYMVIGWDETAAMEAYPKIWDEVLMPAVEKRVQEYFEAAGDITLTRERIYPHKLGEVPKGDKKSEKKDDKEEGKIAAVVDTDAERDAGETDVTIPGAVAAAILGGLAAAAGAGVGGGAGSGGKGDGGDDDDDEGSSSSYKMYLKKDFGDTIQYDEPPVSVYARIAEITSGGEEVDRRDLTARLEMFSGRGLTVKSGGMEGNYKGALVSVETVPGGPNPADGILSVRLDSGKGSFQNNVTFQLIGEAFISLGGENLSVLVGSGEKFTLPVQFVDFINRPTDVSFEGDPLPIGIEADEGDNYYIHVTDDTPKPETISTFYEAYPYRISAKDGDKLVTADFTVLKCYEGILIDFLGKENEILAYKDMEDEMPVTDLGFQLGVWDEENKRLEQQAPAELEISYTDEEKIFEIIGLSFEKNEGFSTSDSVVYSFTAEKSLPAPEKIKGILTYASKIGDVPVKNEAVIFLVPDLLVYAKEWEKEFKNCEKTIFTYLPIELAKKKYDELIQNKDKLGLEDLKLFRKYCWNMASRIIMQEKEDYLREVYKYDEWIATADFITHVGDLAFNAAIAPCGGAVTLFLINNVKDITLELYGEFIQKEGALDWETMQNVLWNRFKYFSGNMTDFVELRKSPDKKAIIAWVTYLFVNQFFHHWYFDRDEDGNRLGVYEAFKSAIYHTIIQASFEKVRRGMREYANFKGKGRSVETWMESKKLKEGFDAVADQADKVAEGLDEAIEGVAKTVIDFIKNIEFV